MIFFNKMFFNPHFLLLLGGTLLLSGNLNAAITLNNSCAPGVTDDTPPCVTENTALMVEPWVLQMTQQFEKDCRAEAVGSDGKRAGSINFVFHKDDFTIKQVLSSVEKVILSGPFSFTASPGISEIDTTIQKLLGRWELFPTGVSTDPMDRATFIKKDYDIYASYVSSVDIYFYVLPGVSCADIPNIDSLCPSAKSTFHSAMTGLASAIRLRSPSPALPDPTYNFPSSACTALTKPDLSGAIADPHGPAVVGLPTGTPIRDITGY